MAFTETSVTRVARVTESGILEVQREDKVFKDGVEISKTYHRHTVNPGDDLTGQDPVVDATARAVWTPENISAFSSEVLATLEVERVKKQAALDDIAAKQSEIEVAQAALISKQVELDALNAPKVDVVTPVI